MMALRITWFPLCPGENGWGMKGERGGGARSGARSKAGGRGAKSGFKLRDNVVAPRRPQRAGWVRLLNDSAQILSLSNTGGRTDADGRTDHNVARRERQFTSRTDGRTRTVACRRRRHLWARGAREKGNAHMSIRWAGSEKRREEKRRKGREIN